MKAKHVWVVEMWNDAYCSTQAQWEPTVGVKLNREEARRERDDWKRRNPFYRFRIRPYVQLSRE